MTTANPPAARADFSVLVRSRRGWPPVWLGVAVLAAAVSWGCAASGTDTANGEGGRWAEEDAAEPAWVRGQWPDAAHVYAVGTIVFPEGTSRRDALRRAARQSVEQIARELETHVPQLEAYLAELLPDHPEAEQALREEAQAFAERESTGEAIAPPRWLALRVRENLLLVVQNETFVADRPFQIEEPHEIDETANYFDGHTGQRREPEPGVDHWQVYVLGAVSRERLREVFAREVAAYGIELATDEAPAYLLGAADDVGSENVADELDVPAE